MSNLKVLETEKTKHVESVVGIAQEVLDDCKSDTEGVIALVTVVIREDGYYLVRMSGLSSRLQTIGALEQAKHDVLTSGGS